MLFLFFFPVFKMEKLVMMEINYDNVLHAFYINGYIKTTIRIFIPGEATDIILYNSSF